MNRKKKVLVVSPDMSVAFDLLYKYVLIQTMLKLGIPHNICDIYINFLTDRRAYVQKTLSNELF